MTRKRYKQHFERILESLDKLLVERQRISGLDQTTKKETARRERCKLLVAEAAVLWILLAEIILQHILLDLEHSNASDTSYQKHWLGD